MSHAFFSNINWDDIYYKRIEPPFKPTITNATDTSNFDTEFTSVTPVLTPVNTGMNEQVYLIGRICTDNLKQFSPSRCRKSSADSLMSRTSTRVEKRKTNPSKVE